MVTRAITGGADPARAASVGGGSARYLERTSAPHAERRSWPIDAGPAAAQRGPGRKGSADPDRHAVGNEAEQGDRGGQAQHTQRRQGPDSKDTNSAGERGRHAQEPDGSCARGGRKADAAREDDRAGGHDSAEDDSSSASGNPDSDPYLAWLLGLLQAAPGGAGTQSAAAAGAQGATAAGQALPPDGKNLPALPDMLALSNQLDSGKLLGADGELDAAAHALLARLGATDAGAPAPGASAGKTDGAAGLFDLSSLLGAVSLPGGHSSQAANASGAQYSGAQSMARFEQTLSQGVMWMVGQGVRDAQLHVHPDHLGPIDIHVKLDGDATQVSIHSPHAVVRHALADAAPRLRELLGGAGLSLSQLDVGAQAFQQGRNQGESSERRGGKIAGVGGVAAAGGAPSVDYPAPADWRARGLVDTFA